MTPEEARVLLELPEPSADSVAVRSAYLRGVSAARLDTHPDRFVLLRDAYELLSHGAGAAGREVEAAREALAAQPESIEARWNLLSYFPYATSPEAFPILRDGASSRPGEFLDELLFHFPEKVQPAILRAARDAAGLGRLLLIADVHATQGRPAEALEVLQAALAAGELQSPAAIRLALRPIFSLQAHAQRAAAGEALALVKQRVGRLALADPSLDPETATILRIADELGRLGPSLPLDLRQVAAGAAKRGDFDNAPYEARFATRLLKPREVRALSKRLEQDAPAVAKMLGLGLTEAQLRIVGVPTFRIPLGWGTVIVTLVLALSWLAHKMREKPIIDVANTGRSILDNMARQMIRRDCADPNSDACYSWDDEATRKARYGGANGNGSGQDGGSTLPAIEESIHRKTHQKSHQKTPGGRLERPDNVADHL